MICFSHMNHEVSMTAAPVTPEAGERGAVLRSGRTAENITLFFCPGGVQRVFRDPLELERGPLRRGGPRKQKS